MHRRAHSLAIIGFLIAVAIVPSCRKKEQPAATPPQGSASSPPLSASSPPSSTSPQPASPAPAAAAAADPPAVSQPIASTDIDTPTPLTAKAISGTGLKRRVSYFYSLSGGPGTITLTGSAKNAPAASATALAASLLTPNAGRLCSINLGNTTTEKKESTTCDADKTQPLILRIDLDEETIDFKIELEGVLRLADPGAAAVTDAPAAGAGSTDIDAPTRLTGPAIKGSGTQQASSYYYALNAGPGEVRLIADGRNTSAATADALQLKLVNLRSEEICGVSLGNVTRDERKVTTCRLDVREPMILRVNLDPNTVDWRARLEGAVDFEAYTPPKTITIALNERVLFDSGKAELKPESRQTLLEAAARVKKFGSVPVTIAGHTDNIGTEAANLKLSQDRASAVRTFFVTEAALAADRLTVKAFGQSQPVADNSTPDGRARNRRVEVIIAR